MSLQIALFAEGGFALHQAVDGRTSAWFDETGRYLDGEFRDTLGRYRPVLPGSVRQRKLAVLGGLLASINNNKPKEA